MSSDQPHRQADNAILFYEARTHSYDNTWHTDFTKRFISYLDIQPGAQVLDLACGTGLLTFLEAEAVGPTGSVTGIDVTPGMLSVAAHKKQRAEEKYSNVELHEGDILHLDEIKALKGKTFDVITVASALVLFPDPQKAIEHWATYLKPGGVLAADSTHPRNLVSGMVLERTARRLELPIPYNREWSKSEDSLKDVLESAGLEVEKVVSVEDQAGYGTRYYAQEEWDDFFVENVIVKDVARTFANNDIRRKAQGVFKEEWDKLAEDGKVEEIDTVFLGVARKPADGSRYVPKAKEEPVFNGGCRCGAVQYECSAAPSDITLCHCRACQQVSGAPFLPFVDVPTNAVTFTEESGRKKLKLSDVAERTFCSKCGTPITMNYAYEPENTGFTVGSIDMESMKCERPKVWRHILLSEKASWLDLPDDGTERFDSFSAAHLVQPYAKAKTS